MNATQDQALPERKMTILVSEYIHYGISTVLPRSLCRKCILGGSFCPCSHDQRIVQRSAHLPHKLTLNELHRRCCTATSTTMHRRLSIESLVERERERLQYYLLYRERPRGESMRPMMANNTIISHTHARASSTSCHVRESSW